jgi:hypothetical protein
VVGLWSGPRLHWECVPGQAMPVASFLSMHETPRCLDKQTRDELLMHARSQLTLMSFLKFYHLTEPTHRIHDSVRWESRLRNPRLNGHERAHLPCVEISKQMSTNKVLRAVDASPCQGSIVQHIVAQVRYVKRSNIVRYSCGMMLNLNPQPHHGWTSENPKARRSAGQ